MISSPNQERIPIEPSSHDSRIIMELVLHWYDQNRRRLPWRALPGETPDPYKVWISEVMLQQTQVATATPYFERFLIRFPDIQALAQASLDEVFLVWQGLGYYRRAKALHQTAQILSKASTWPQDEETWKALPGIGVYTASAIRTIAFGKSVVPVDGNIRRIFGRLFNFFKEKPQEKAKKAQKIANFWPQFFSKNKRWGDLAQGLMDLGAIVCTPHPHCEQCPVASFCAYQPNQSQTGSKVEKKRSIRYGYALCLLNEKGELYLEKEEDKHLLNGLMRVPIVNGEGPQAIEQWKTSSHAPAICHVFSHFEWRLQIIFGQTHEASFSNQNPSIEKGQALFQDPIPLEVLNLFPLVFKGSWISAPQWSEYAFSSLMRKILLHVKGQYLLSKPLVSEEK